MMPFDHVFMDVARSESRAIETTDPAGRRATFLFREFYCTEPRCDCRRVVLHVHWVEKNRVAASINYAFQPSRRRDEPQMFLDPLNPQSEYSPGLLALFTEMITEDREYRARLIRHYTMWKKVVDDPKHPSHAKVHGKAHDDASFRPAFPRKEPRSSARRAEVAAGGRRGEGGTRPSAASAASAASDGAAESRSLERIVGKSGQVDSKLQQRFRRVVQKVDQLKQRVRAWKEARANIDTEISRYQALLEQVRRLSREMVELLDRSYRSPVFSKVERKKLAALICEVAGELIEAGGHDDLKPLYNRYSRSDFDAEVAAVEAAGAETLRSMMEMFGVEFGDADVSSMEKLKEFTEAQMRAFEDEAAAEEAAEAARRARRKKSAKQVAAEARREEERRRSGKALQEVYRALAMALHPDREQDPAERARKTEVMREVNVAYEAKDLLRLLELQLELEQVEPERVDAIAEERLRRYCQILDEQAKQLATEIEELELPFRLELEVAPSRRLRPADVIARIREDAEAVEQHMAEVLRDLAAFREVGRLKAWLKRQARRRGGDGAFEPDLFA